VKLRPENIGRAGTLSDEPQINCIGSSPLIYFQCTLEIQPYVDTENAANGCQAFIGPCRTPNPREFEGSSEAAILAPKR